MGTEIKMREKDELRHVGIIMDGNGRWAANRGLPRYLGHKEGSSAVNRVVRYANEIKIPYLSLYAFSTENWHRPQDEVRRLMELLSFYAKSAIKDFNNENARLLYSGNLSIFPRETLQLLRDGEKATAGNSGMTVVICINYGGRQEILDAFNALLAAGVQAPVTEELLRRHFYLPDMPDPDLMIRTSGELRMSNFWLWQGAYSEYYFCEKHWPDFGKEDLQAAIDAYYRRDRRYGKIQ